MTEHQCRQRQLGEYGPPHRAGVQNFVRFAVVVLLTVWPTGRREHRARRVLAVGWALAGLGALAETLLQGAAAAGTGPGTVLRPELISATLDSNYGRQHVLRLVLLILIGVLLAETLRPNDWWWI